MLPPEISKQFSPHYFAGFREPPLWVAYAGQGYRSRIRLTIAGILKSKASIRIDERDNGRLTGHLVFVRLDNKGHPRERNATPFRVSRAQWGALRQAVERARLWNIYPEFYGYGEGGELICIDGMQLIFERVDSNGYRFSTANAQCNAPEAVRRAAAEMIEISGAEDVMHWLD
jgi:hypothetical protein